MSALADTTSEAAARHSARFDACDMCEVITDELLAAVKSGNEAEAGRLLVAGYRAHIAALADWSTQ